MAREIREIPELVRYKYRHIGTQWTDDQIELPSNKIFYTVVAIMRANPPHINHTLMLRELCDQAVNVKLNLGSANKFDKKNPFRIEEREEMMRLALDGYKNFELLRLPDVDNDELWFKNLREINDSFTEILSNNSYDLNIYRKNQYAPGKDKIEHNRNYDIIQPTDIIDQKRMRYVTGVVEDGATFLKAKKPTYISGTLVRTGMVNNWNWEGFVDPKVAEYLKKSDLVTRLRKLCPDLKGKTLADLYEGR